MFVEFFLKTQLDSAGLLGCLPFPLYFTFTLPSGVGREVFFVMTVCRVQHKILCSDIRDLLLSVLVYCVNQ